MPTITGTSGADTYIVSEASTINAGDGDDVVIALGTGNIVNGEAGNDIIAGRGNDAITGGDGDDIILAAGGGNTLDGGDGNDTIYGGDGGNVIDGGDGNDRLLAGLSFDTIHTGGGDNIVELGKAGDAPAARGDFVYGGSGNDIYKFAFGASIMDSGGIDTLDFSGEASGLIANMENGTFSTYYGLYGAWNYAQHNKIAAQQGLEFMTLVDVTASMWSDIGYIGLALTVDMEYYFTRLGFPVPTARTAVAVFGDRPVEPYGEPTGLYADSGVALVKPFTGNLSGISGREGGDDKDGQIEALLHVARNATAMGFTPDALRVVMVITDSIPHVAGDFLNGIPNNGDGVLDPNEDYPSVEQLRTALLDAKITPIFNVKAAVFDYYQALVDQLGFGTVVLLNDTGSNVVQSIDTGLHALLDDLLENVIGTQSADYITGNAKDNVMYGEEGFDQLYGLDGNDTIDGGRDGDLLVGGDGDDLLYGMQGGDELHGGDGDDTFFVYRVAPEAYRNTSQATSLETVEVSDSSGIDTLNFALGRTAAVITLVADGVSTLDNRTVTLQSGTQIENAVGTAFADTITGNTANNRIDGGAGGDSMSGGQGNDTYVVDDALDTVIELNGGGVDTVEAGTSHTLSDNVEHLILTGIAAIDGTGNALNNRLTGNSGSNVLHGEDGNDSLVGGGGRDILFGGSGTDKFIFTSAGDSLTGLDNSDVIADWEAGELIDLTLVDANPNSIGVQRLAFIGLGTADTVVLAGHLKYYHSDDNTYVVADMDFDGLADFQITIEGIHTLTNADFDGIGLPIAGNENANTLTGTTTADVILGLAGDDTLRGQAGNDRLVGGAGKDTLTGGTGTDSYVYAGVSDSAYGAASRDSITDFDGLDRFDFFGFDADAVAAGVQRFTFIGQGSADASVAQGQIKYYHSNGNTYLVGNIGADSTADFEIELVGFQTLGAEHFVGLDPAIVGTPDADTISGTEDGERLLGLAGADTIYGLGGDDRIFGDAGSDTIDGGTGADQMTGGVGSDTYVVDNVGDRVVELKSAGTDSVFSSVAFSLTGQYIENLTLTGSGNNKATGNSYANIIRGNDGNNQIDGREGKDQMHGGLGNDTYVVDNAGDRVYELNGQGTDHVKSSVSFALAGQFIENLTLTGLGNIDATGNGYANVLTGNGGHNTLDGLVGSDTLAGGGGSDDFVFSTALNRVSNVDTILDFVSGVDRFNLDRAVFSAFTADGTLPDTAFKNLALGAVDSTDRIVFDEATGEVFYDVDGSGSARSVLFAIIDNGAVLTSDDFLLI